MYKGLEPWYNSNMNERQQAEKIAKQVGEQIAELSDKLLDVQSLMRADASINNRIDELKWDLLTIVEQLNDLFEDKLG